MIRRGLDIYSGDLFDKNGVLVSPGCVLYINQTVNGQSEFYVESLNPLDVRYNYDRSRKYEYNPYELFYPCTFTGEVDFEVVTK